jgi:hypothetical protein
MDNFAEPTVDVDDLPKSAFETYLKDISKDVLFPNLTRYQECPFKLKNYKV